MPLAGSRRRPPPGGWSWSSGPVTEADVDAAWLVVAATANPEVDAAVTRWCEARRTWCISGTAGTARSVATTRARRPRGRRRVGRRARPEAGRGRARRAGAAPVDRAGRPAPPARAPRSRGAGRWGARATRGWSPRPGRRRWPPPTWSSLTGSARPVCSSGYRATSRSCTSARPPHGTRCRRPRSTACWSNGPGAARSWCGSRVATRSCTAVGARRCTPAALRASRSRSCPASARRSPCRCWPASR